MILKDNFYQIKNLKQQENQLIATIELNANDLIFEGHFPGNPVTPGVAQLEIIKEILSVHYNCPIALKSISNCKYLAILNPVQNATVAVSITINEVESELKIAATFSSEATVFTKVAGVYLIS